MIDDGPRASPIMDGGALMDRGGDAFMSGGVSLMMDGGAFMSHGVGSKMSCGIIKRFIRYITNLLNLYVLTCENQNQYTQMSP